MENKYDNNYLDKDMIKTLIDSRDSNYFLMPLYVNIFGKKYAILDIPNITQSVPISSFKVGFGTSYSVISNCKSFPTKEMYKYNCEDAFKYTDEETSVDTHYFIIEETRMNDESSDIIDKEINMWIDSLYSKSESYAKAYKQNLIKEQLEIMNQNEDDNDDIITDNDDDDDEVTDYADYFE